MTLRRVLALAASRPWWLLLGASVAAIAVMANVGLVAMSAYLISRAQTATNVADLAIAITMVRVLAIGRAVARYIERIVIHAGTFRVLADLRSWFFASIEPLAPARLRVGPVGRPAGEDRRRRGHARGGVRGRRRAARGGGRGAGLRRPCCWGRSTPGRASRCSGSPWSRAWSCPRWCARLSRGPARERIARRSLATALALDGVRGMADLAALDRDASHRTQLLARGRGDGRVDGTADGDPRRGGSGGRGARRPVRRRRAVDRDRGRARWDRAVGAARGPAAGRDRGLRGRRLRWRPPSSGSTRRRPPVSGCSS